MFRYLNVQIFISPIIKMSRIFKCSDFKCLDIACIYLLATRHDLPHDFPHNFLHDLIHDLLHDFLHDLLQDFLQDLPENICKVSAGLGRCRLRDILSFAADSIELFLHHVWHAVPYLTYVFTELKLGDEDYHDGY